MRAVSIVNLINHKPLSSGIYFKGEVKKEENNQEILKNSQEKPKESLTDKIKWYSWTIPAAVALGLSTGFLGHTLSIFGPPQGLGINHSARDLHGSHSILKGVLIEVNYNNKSYPALKTSKDGVYILREAQVLSPRYSNLKLKGKIRPGVKVEAIGVIKPLTNKNGDTISNSIKVFEVEDIKTRWF